ncbi:MAG TPA: thiamine-phosphate kinase [Gammaproteobacteria bacterium]|nr:thiamine-phosphate kinase [Gammaproteobacteria bacterium]
MLVEAWELPVYSNLYLSKFNLVKGVKTLNEHQLIQEYFSEIGSAFLVEQGIRVPIGDDAAVISSPKGKESVISVDTSIGGVHFLESMHASDIAYRSVSVALSDLAACGATPAWFTLALSLKKYDPKWLSDFKKGLEDISAELKIPLIGGDTTKGNLSITVQVGGYVEAGKALTREGARIGDVIYVTGCIGAASSALDNLRGGNLTRLDKNRYLRPKIRFEVSSKLLDIASSAIDISDGLFQDLDHICKASKVGAVICLEKIPTFLSNSLTIDEINRGDDYEILFTSDKSNREKIKRIAKEENIPICEIGSINEGDEVDIFSPDGVFLKASSGYQHF